MQHTNLKTATFAYHVLYEVPEENLYMSKQLRLFFIKFFIFPLFIFSLFLLQVFEMYQFNETSERIIFKEILSNLALENSSRTSSLAKSSAI